MQKNSSDYLGLDINNSNDKNLLINSLSAMCTDLSNMTIDDYAISENPFYSHVTRVEKIYPSGKRTVEYSKTIYLSRLATSELLESGCSSPLHGQLVHEISHKVLHTDDIGYATSMDLINDISREDKRTNADSWSTFYLKIMRRQ